ncbi:uncharacterized protein LOC116296630 isoform X2 [Actinia tenebrosa]|nr:uncharacterized protein LOC116296630 isoform X2 [Actinia tenebrosa]XP_031560537.1 uncharacterized protein LOC116296630 isoform X2 [Actinia tenebrosa]XP_031560538.1 uncharacterized protein LOC116296630 isoform X2 [Actinia tenebrosa]
MKRMIYHAVDQFYRHRYCNHKTSQRHYSSYSRKNKEQREKQSLYTLDELKKLHQKQHHQKNGDQRHNDHQDHDRLSDHENTCNSLRKTLWKKRLHFVELPLFKFGNWIPYIMNHWQCFGSSCALSQVAIKSKSGDIIKVMERLDARYDWLPSPHTLVNKHKSLKLKYYGDACASIDHVQNKSKKNYKTNKKILRNNKHKKGVGELALVTASGDCSFFDKIVHMSRAKVDAMLIIKESNKPLQQLACHGKHCYFPLRIAASMIRHEDGMAIKDKLLSGQDLFASFQSTPQENFFFAIDGQGKLAEIGLFLYPSMLFMGYEAKWFNYKTDLIHNLTGSARIIHVFNHTLMEGRKGAVTTIKLPPTKELLLYRNVELDMTLHCASKYDYDCPHWDHVVQLTICCNKRNPLCNEELGRWITPFRRGIGRWLTKITPLLPLFTGERCTLTMRHPFWERAWRPSLDIRLSDHIHYSKHHYSGHHEDEFIVPYKAIKLFSGGKFDKHYNERYKPIKFKVGRKTERVKLVATITGHGSDNHGCAEFCVTSHHFVINGETNVRVFKNAASAMGCANRVEQGVTPNEHGTWLYGRNGWCCGQEVVPWVVDVTDQIYNNGSLNTVKYFGWFNGTDPNPTRDSGNILMNSFLIFYMSSDELE